MADSRFSYLEKLRFGLGYAATPVYWFADIPTGFRSGSMMCSFPGQICLEENERLRGDLLIAQRELQLLESLASENSRLRDLREATQVINDEVLPAEIINVSPDSNSREGSGQ